jgi:hypothetical protein
MIPTITQTNKGPETPMDLPSNKEEGHKEEGVKETHHDMEPVYPADLEAGDPDAKGK